LHSFFGPRRVKCCEHLLSAVNETALLSLAYGLDLCIVAQVRG